MCGSSHFKLKQVLLTIFVDISLQGHASGLLTGSQDVVLPGHANGLLTGSQGSQEAFTAAPKETLAVAMLQDEGMKAMSALDKSLDEFTALLDAKDKQEIPIKQQEALGFVGAMEEAMVKGFPYKVPAQYANLPQLKARALSTYLLPPPAPESPGLPRTVPICSGCLTHVLKVVILPWIESGLVPPAAHGNK